MAILVSIHGDHHALADGDTTIGGADADVVCEAGRAVIRGTGDAWVLHAHDGEWFVDDHPVEREARLAHAAEVRVGLVNGWRLLLGDPARALDEDRHVATVRDGLTGLYNRNFLHRPRLPAGTPLLYADLDRFKSLNNVHGHGVGDLVLRRTGAILRAHVRWPEFAARFGGEEFVVALPGASRADARARAEAIRVAHEAPFAHAGRELVATVTIGIAATIREAEAKLIEGKLAGHNRVVD